MIVLDKSLRNPFLVEGYAGPDYFCDRKKEAEMLKSALLNGRNVTLMAPRRMGKSGLIKHVFYEIQRADSNAACFYLDVLATKNMTDFVRLFAETLLGGLESLSDTVLKKLMRVFGSLRPTLKFDAVTGSPALSLELSQAESPATLEKVFSYLQQSKKEVFIAIDEFQQVVRYPEGNTPEALLRACMQSFPGIHFIFSGSSMKMMGEMFLASSRPFYQSTQMMQLGCIDHAEYRIFAAQFFQKAGRAFSDAVFDALYDRFEGHTWYIQMVLNRLYSTETDVTQVQQMLEVIGEVLQENRLYYSGISRLLTNNQYAVLQAVAKEGVVREPQGAAFIVRHGLPAASSVSASIRSLVDNELLRCDEDGAYRVYDRFFGLWLATI